MALEDKIRCNELLKEKHSNWIGLSNQKAIRSMLEELDRLQKENDLAKKALIANSYEADERNNLLVKIQKLQKEKEELKNERDSYRTQVNSAFDKGFIHKDKIREKIEELNKEINSSIDNSKGGLDEEFIDKGTELLAQKRVLQDLLNEE